MSLGESLVPSFFRMTINSSFFILELDDSTQKWSIEQASQFRRNHPYRQRNRRGRGGGIKMQGGDCWSRSDRLRLGNYFVVERVK